MKKYYFLLIYLMFNVIAKSQVQGPGWYETFETMLPNQLPSGDWLTGNSTVIGSPHGVPGFGDNRQSLSSHLNIGVQIDSIFTPKITGFQGLSCGYTFYYRICNWLSNSITSPVTLSTGDTCSVSFYKYNGYNLAGIIPLYKIHSGNHNPDTNFTPSPGYLFPNIFYSDTFRIAIHIKKGNSGNYWYDFDRFEATYFTGITDRGNNHLINLYPNPTKNMVSFQSDKLIKNMELTDIYGKSIEFAVENNHLTYHIHFDSSLTPGLYFISIKTDSETINSKFLKE